MADNFIISGAGGQGVISAGQFLASLFMYRDYHVTFSCCYGAEMRGGAVNCEVAVDDKEIYSLRNDKADYIIAFNQTSYDKFLPKLKENGVIIVNSSMVKDERPREDVKYVFAPLSEEAVKLGNIKFANTIALGILGRLLNSFSKEDVAKACEKALQHKQHLIEKNIEAYNKGYDYILEEQYAR